MGNDPREEHNLSAEPQHAGRVKELMAKLAELQRQFGDTYPLDVPNPKPAQWSPEKLTPQDIEAQMANPIKGSA